MPNAPLLGQPLYPQYRKPPRWLPLLFVVAGFAMAAIGTYSLAVAEHVGCRGRAGTLCLLASALLEAMFGVANHALAEAAVWFAFALLFWAFAWHLHAMWFRHSVPGPQLFDRSDA